MTHFCIALCNVLHGRYLSRTAYFEVNASHAIAALSTKKDPTIPFSHQGVSYYPGVMLRQLPEWLRLPHKYKILDFGVLNAYTFPEFMRCDYHVVFTNVSIWKTGQLEQFIEEIKKTNTGKDKKTNIHFLCTGDLKKDRDRIRRAYGIRVIPVPFLSNPFQVSSKHFGFFEQIWKGT